jgi:FAD/FMN-containing dehydrogenase
VRIGPGARWAQVAAALGEHGCALSSGDYGGVGVGGLTTAGGKDSSREHGLYIDHLRAAEVVLADATNVSAMLNRENQPHRPARTLTNRAKALTQSLVSPLGFCD